VIQVEVTPKWLLLEARLIERAGREEHRQDHDVDHVMAPVSVAKRPNRRREAAVAESLHFLSEKK
jgi:hypothetical protein